MKRRALLLTIASITAVFAFGWNLTARAAYESAPYKVLKKEGNIEIREYPDLLLAATGSKVASNGRDGSFMKLFRYISGANETKQKIAMTTPVFMEDGVKNPEALMGFVMPQSVAESGAPAPTNNGVVMHNRKGGRFAVIRFSGRINTKMAKQQEAALRTWLSKNGIAAGDRADTAGYDPPFTPGPFRRNEILIPLVDKEGDTPVSDAEAGEVSRDPQPVH